MDESDNVKCPEKYSGPCRETAQSMLERRIKTLRAEADGLEKILSLLGKEAGTPEELAMWELLTRTRSACQTTGPW